MKREEAREHGPCSPPIDGNTTLFTADIVVLVGREILLIQRRSDPYAGMWALPGGHWQPGKDGHLAVTAMRELHEETGIAVITKQLHLIGIFDTPGRDPRGPAVTTAFVVRFSGKPDARAGDDAVEVAWFSVDELPELAFDHAEIIGQALQIA